MLKCSDSRTAQTPWGPQGLPYVERAVNRQPGYRPGDSQRGETTILPTKMHNKLDLNLNIE